MTLMVMLNMVRDLSMDKYVFFEVNVMFFKTMKKNSMEVMWSFMKQNCIKYDRVWQQWQEKAVISRTKSSIESDEDLKNHQFEVRFT